MASKRDNDLERYFDGELGRRRARRVHQQLEADPAARRHLADLQRQRALLREMTEAAAEEADFSGLWSRVQAGTERQAPLPWSERVALWLRRHGLVLASAGAAAAVLLVLLLYPMQLSRKGGNAATIENLDVGPAAASTIFTIADPEDKDVTTVIWVTEASTEGDQ